MVRSIRAEVVNFWGAPRDEVRVRMVWNAVGRGGRRRRVANVAWKAMRVR